MSTAAESDDIKAPLSWDDINQGVEQHFSFVERAPPWLRLGNGDGSTPQQLVAITRTKFLGLEVAVLVTPVCLKDEMSFFLARDANEQVEGGSLVLAEDQYAIRMSLPLSVLSWSMLTEACSCLATAAQRIREFAQTEKKSKILFTHYTE